MRPAARPGGPPAGGDQWARPARWDATPPGPRRRSGAAGHAPALQRASGRTRRGRRRPAQLPGGGGRHAGGARLCPHEHGAAHQQASGGRAAGREEACNPRAGWRGCGGRISEDGGHRAATRPPRLGGARGLRWGLLDRLVGPRGQARGLGEAVQNDAYDDSKRCDHLSLFALGRAAPSPATLGRHATRETGAMPTEGGLPVSGFLGFAQKLRKPRESSHRAKTARSTPGPWRRLSARRCGPVSPAPAARKRDPARPSRRPSERAPRRPAPRGRRLARRAWCVPRAAACGSARRERPPPRGGWPLLPRPRALTPATRTAAGTCSTTLGVLPCRIPAAPGPRRGTRGPASAAQSFKLLPRAGCAARHTARVHPP
jgi:hypothetical protein